MCFASHPWPVLASWLAVASLLFAIGCGEAERESIVTEIAAKTAEAPHPLGKHLTAQYAGGLERVLRDRYLRVLTSKNSFDYFLQSGEPGGYQYEMVRAFVRALNEKYPATRGEPSIQFEMLPVALDQLIPQLLEGRGDLIAARIPITEQRARRVNFSVPYKRVDEEVLTSLDPKRFPHREDLAGHQFAVRKSSTYYSSLVALNRWLAGRGLKPVEIVFVPEELETESILELVARGEYEFTLADSVLATIASEVFEGISAVGIALRHGAELAWATSPGNVDLLAEVDAFLPRYGHGSLLGNVAIQKYFENTDAVSRRLGADGQPALSRYDQFFRKYSEQYGFDWRLVAAVAYQESRFDQTASNPSGATGIFQIKPGTAREKYIGIAEVAGEQNAENNIEAGIKYLAWIRSRYFEPLESMSERNRIRMTLAAYNTGPASLRAARTRAQEMGLDPNRWFRNVELALLEIQKPEPVKYVSEVNKRYISYVLLGVEE
jgi:membrane-bound lytic murein transglycosylase MltF